MRGSGGRTCNQGARPLEPATSAIMDPPQENTAHSTEQSRSQAEGHS